MTRRSLLLAPLLLSICAALSAAEPAPKLDEVKGLPPELSEKIAPLLNPNGYRISDSKGPIAEIWLLKEVPMRDNFQPNETVKYPFTPGQLMGALRLPKSGAESDFRGQELPAGVYTLRYGYQPQDGNHLGTSDVRDFLLACPAKTDVDPKNVEPPTALFKLSAKAAGTTHPAVFLLFPPPEKAFAAPAIAHESEKNLWVLDVNANGKTKDKSASLPLQIVVVGKAEG